jgi:hypothetical protein
MLMSEPWARLLFGFSPRGFSVTLSFPSDFTLALGILHSAAPGVHSEDFILN